MTDKKLFVVTITTEIIVVADSESDAEHLARYEKDIEWADVDYSACPMRHMPGEWDGDSIPFGDRLEEEPDRTVNAWIERGAAPEYKVRTKAAKP
jgi:hypothetical protein